MEREEERGDKMSSARILMILLIFGIIINLGFMASQASISLSVDIYPKEGIVSAGDEVLLQVNLIQLLDQKRKDVVVAISLISSDDKEVMRSTETIALETKASFVSRLDIPENIKEGDYNINVEVFDVNGENLLGKASERITIENRITKEDIYLIGVYLIAACLIIFIIISYKRYRNFRKDHKKRITRRDLGKYLRQEED